MRYAVAHAYLSIELSTQNVIELRYKEGWAMVTRVFHHSE